MNYGFVPVGALNALNVIYVENLQENDQFSHNYGEKMSENRFLPYLW